MRPSGFLRILAPLCLAVALVSFLWISNTPPPPYPNHRKNAPPPSPPPRPRRWVPCDAERELATVRLTRCQRPTLAYILGADLYDDAAGVGSSSFPAFFEAANGTCQPGLHQALSVPARHSGVIEVLVSGDLEWHPCGVTDKWLTHVVTCPGLRKRFPDQTETDRAQIRMREEGSQEEGEAIEFCLREVEPKRFNLTSCVAFGMGPARPRALMEFVEMGRRHGVDHVVLYDRTTSETHYTEIARKFGYLGRDREMEVRWWPGLTWRPANVKDCIGLYDKPAALLHCLWGTRGRSRFVLMADFDEWLFDHRMLANPSLSSRTVESIAEKLEMPGENLSCLTIPKVDLSSNTLYNESKLVVDQFVQLSPVQLNQHKSVCVPERQWGTTVHNGLPAPGFWTAKAADVMFNNSLALAHYVNILSPRYKATDATFPGIRDRWTKVLEQVVPNV